MSVADSPHTVQPFAPLDQSVQSGAQTTRKIIFWHRELPPLDAEYIGEHMIEAASARVPSTLAHRDELWDVCYEDLMARACARLEQEVVRLGGSYAHVLDESVVSHHDDVTGETWLHGSFTYMLYGPTKSRVKSTGT
jgi:hypothetical protein